MVKNIEKNLGNIEFNYVIKICFNLIPYRARQNLANAGSQAGKLDPRSYRSYSPARISGYAGAPISMLTVPVVDFSSSTTICYFVMI